MKTDVVIPIFGGSSWTAGINYIRNLKNAVQAYTDDIEIHLVEINTSENKSLLAKGLRELKTRLKGYDPKLMDAIDKINSTNKVVFTSGYKPVRKGAPHITWIPDFQELSLPGMFSKSEIMARSYLNRLAVKRSDLVVLSSESAFKDYSGFAPRFRDKGRIMRFVSDIDQAIYDTAPMSNLSQFNIPEKFFYLPNQFWKHKNHSVIFEALAKLKQKNIKPVVICTGNTKDYRNPEFFSELKQTIVDMGIEDQVILLGLVPFASIFHLYRQAIAVINPSLFEGWSTTVEESKSLGKKMLLSDIAVHIEQAPPKSFYFSARSADSASELIEQIWINTEPGPDLELEHAARQQLPVRMKKYAETFRDIVLEALDKSR